MGISAAIVALGVLGAAPAPAATIEVFRDVSYARAVGDEPLTAVDVYAPKSGKMRPAVLFVHGGGWRRGDKANVGIKPKAFTDKGFVFVSTNYRLVPDVTFREQAADVARAIKLLRDRAEEYSVDPSRLYLMGHSAGAHLAALVSTDATYLQREGLDLDAIRGTILLDGAGYDIANQVRQAGPNARRLYQGVFGDDPAEQAAASPATHVARGKGIPAFLILFVADRPDSRMQSRGLAKKLSQAGVRARAVPAEGKTHRTINQELGQPGDEPTREVFEFLEIGR